MDSRVGAEVMAITSVQDIDFRINGFEGGCWPPFQDIDFGIIDSRVGAGLRSGYRLRDNGFEGWR